MDPTYPPVGTFFAPRITLAEIKNKATLAGISLPPQLGPEVASLILAEERWRGESALRQAQVHRVDGFLAPNFEWVERQTDAGDLTRTIWDL